jgi:putative hydrolase of the HAD superfamily
MSNSSLPKPIKVIGLDGDDTLWHNENIFSMTQTAFRTLVEAWLEPTSGDVGERLNQTEIRNLRLFGYGVKGFTLSMIETAIELTGGKIPASEIQRIVEYGKAMLSHPVELLDTVNETVRTLASQYKLVVITKGDLFDQESKIAGTGLGELFWKVEVVSEKDPATYQRLLERNHVNIDEFLMVGNSVRSDVLPVVELGGRAVHVPYKITWSHEHVDTHIDSIPNAWEIERLSQVIDLLPTIESTESPEQSATA